MTAPMVSVPVEPTEAMLKAAHAALLSDIPPDGDSAYGPTISTHAIYRAYWAAMLSAAPAPQPVQGEAVAWMTPSAIAQLAKQNGVAKVDAWNCADGGARVPVFTQPPAPAVGDGKGTKCRHAETVASYDYARCVDCGAVHTDSGWGIAKNMWFASVDAARFFKQTGRLPDPTPAVQIAAPGDIEPGGQFRQMPDWIDPRTLPSCECWAALGANKNCPHCKNAVRAYNAIRDAALRSQGQADAVVVSEEMIAAGMSAFASGKGDFRASISAAITAALAQRGKQGTAMSDSLEALAADMRTSFAYRDMIEGDEAQQTMREYADRLESIARQHREEVDEARRHGGRFVLRAEAAEAALGEARDALYEAWEFFAHYSSMNEPAQDDIAEEKNEMLNKMLTVSNWKPQP